MSDQITIESDERGFVLHVEGESFRIEEPEALYAAVKREIGPWIYERDQAKLAFLCSPEDVDESAGMREAYPDFHSVNADIWDAREGK